MEVYRRYLEIDSCLTCQRRWIVRTLNISSVLGDWTRCRHAEAEERIFYGRNQTEYKIMNCLMMQQIPKPTAQCPPEVPPLAWQSVTE